MNLKSITELAGGANIQQKIVSQCVWRRLNKGNCYMYPHWFTSWQNNLKLLGCVPSDLKVVFFFFLIHCFLIKYRNLTLLRAFIPLKNNFPDSQVVTQSGCVHLPSARRQASLWELAYPRSDARPELSPRAVPASEDFRLLYFFPLLNQSLGDGMQRK